MAEIGRWVLFALGLIGIAGGAGLLLGFLKAMKNCYQTRARVIESENKIPLVGRTKLLVNGRYTGMECRYQGDIRVTVEFRTRSGQQVQATAKQREQAVLKTKGEQPPFFAFNKYEAGKEITILCNKNDAGTIELRSFAWYLLWSLVLFLIGALFGAGGFFYAK